MQLPHYPLHIQYFLLHNLDKNKKTNKKNIILLKDEIESLGQVVTKELINDIISPEVQATIITNGKKNLDNIEGNMINSNYYTLISHYPLHIFSTS